MPAVPARFPYRVMRGVLVAAGVLYCSLLLELVAGYPLDVHGSFLSELGVALVLHEITSTVAGVGSVAVGIFAVLVLRRSGWGGRWGRVVAALAAGVAVTQAWLGIETGQEVLTGSDLHPPGILQRVSVGLVCLMLATLLPGLRQAFTR